MNEVLKSNNRKNKFDVETVMNQIREKIAVQKLRQEELRYMGAYYYKSMDYFREQEKIVLFGVGKFGALLYREMLANGINSIVGVCDNNENQIGAIFYAHQILSPLDAVKKYPDACFVISPVHYENEIMIQLAELGVPVRQIRIFNMKMCELE